MKKLLGVMGALGALCVIGPIGLALGVLIAPCFGLILLRASLRNFEAEMEGEPRKESYEGH